MIRTWDKYFESLNIPSLKLDDVVSGIKPADKGHRNIIALSFNTLENYIDVDDKNKHIFKVNDLTGDILNNQRVQFNVIVFGKQEIEEIIKNNISNLAIAEFYSNLPNNLNIFGVDLKPISFVNKDDLKFTFDNILTIEELLRIITTVSGYIYKFEKDGYYIWTKQL